jgi:ornithine--oxo-acid transaminase
MGARMMAGLQSLRADAVKEVRGRGLMIAIELHPQAGGARRYCQALQGLGVLAKETHDHTIRIAPPLVITADQVDWAVERFATALAG